MNMSLAAVFQIGSLGDSIVSIPSLLSIRELLPDCTDYILITGFQSNAKLSSSAVFEMAWKPAQSFSFFQTGSRWRRFASAAGLFARLRYLRPKYCVYLMPSERTERQVARDATFFRAAGIRNLIGFRALSEPERLDRREACLRFRRLWGSASDERLEQYATPPFLCASGDAVLPVTNWLQANRRFPQRPIVAFCPFSNCSARDLPPETSAQILRGLEAGLRAEAVVVGGAKDKQRGAELVQTAGVDLNACGIFDVRHSAALLSLCSLAVCAESGPMHLAGALGVPVVAVFSRVNVSMKQWLPLGVEQTVLYHEVPCAGCRLSDCNVPGHPCITRTSAADVLAAAASHLKLQPVSA